MKWYFYYRFEFYIKKKIYYGPDYGRENADFVLFDLVFLSLFFFFFFETTVPYSDDECSSQYWQKDRNPCGHILAEEKQHYCSIFYSHGK